MEYVCVRVCVHAYVCVHISGLAWLRKGLFVCVYVSFLPCFPSTTVYICLSIIYLTVCLSFPFVEQTEPQIVARSELVVWVPEAWGIPH